MAGIYIHIPFCRRACHYCDFHFSTNIRQMEALVKALVGEVELRSHYLGSEPIQTIYFGGGTPSLLPSASIGELLNSIQDHFNVSASAEITLEANPEDLSPQKLRELKALGINRLSLGTQSFIAEELVWMNRMHTPTQAIDSIREAQSVGFDNISIDLIFGLPEQTLQQWELEFEHRFGTRHSAYFILWTDRGRKNQTASLHSQRHTKATRRIHC
jgi:coproporphyrinogen III oxidase-like Fe-S oxidoreductase